MTFHFSLPGARALGGHRARSLFNTLRQIDPTITGLEAEWFYLVEATGPVDIDGRKRLQALLDDAPETAEPGADTQLLYVTASWLVHWNTPSIA